MPAPCTRVVGPGATMVVAAACLWLAPLLAACDPARAEASSWPSDGALARRARRGDALAASHPDLVATLEALAAREPRALPDGPVRRRAIGDAEAHAAFVRTAQSLDALGRPIGVAMARRQSEGAWSWTLAVVVYARGPAKTPVVLRLGHDGGERLGRLTVFAFTTADVHARPARNADYRPINRFALPVDGTWDVLQGGDGPDENLHHGHPEQHFALDLVVRDDDGRVRPREGASLHRPQDHYAYGEVVRAPAPGVVVEAVDGRPDQAPGAPGTGGGNGVVIDHGFGEFGALWHFAPGSLTVQVGDEVRAGQVLGRVGNSGATTLPHLHWHLSTGHGDMQRAALPVVLADLVVDGEIRGHHRPRRGERIARAGPATAAPRTDLADASPDAARAPESPSERRGGQIWLDL